MRLSKISSMAPSFQKETVYTALHRAIGHAPQAADRQRYCAVYYATRGSAAHGQGAWAWTQLLAGATMIMQIRLTC